MDFLDPKELCPDDPAKGEQIKTAVHALMLNPNDSSLRLILLQYAYGDNALYFIGKHPVFSGVQERDRELFELANQVAMSFCCYKLARSIHKYDRYTYSLRSFIESIYPYAKQTVIGYVKGALKTYVIPYLENKQLAGEFEAYLKSDSRNELAYHVSTLWAEVVRGILCKYADIFDGPASVVRKKQVGGVSEAVTAPDGSKHCVKSGYHKEPLLYVALDMSPEECDRALALLQANKATLDLKEEKEKRDKKEGADKRPTMSAAEFERFRLFYLKNCANNTFNQAVNREVNLEIGRLYLCGKMSPAEIINTLGSDYPAQVAEKRGDPSDAIKPKPLTTIKVRGRIYQNIIPMQEEFMKESQSCISGDEPSSPSEAKEGSSA